MNRMSKKIKKEEILYLINRVISEIEKSYTEKEINGIIGLIYKRYKKAKNFLLEGGDPVEPSDDFIIIGGGRAYIDHYTNDKRKSNVMLDFMFDTEKMINVYIKENRRSVERRITLEEIEAEERKYEKLFRKENHGYLGLNTVVSDIPDKEDSEAGYFEEIFYDINSKSLYGVRGRERINIKTKWPEVSLGCYKYPSNEKDILNDIKKVEERIKK